MYTLETSIAVTNDSGARWKELDLANVSMVSIFDTYRAGYLTLSSTLLTEPVYVDINDLRVPYAATLDTLSQMLANLGTMALPTVPSIPVLNPKYAKWSDAFRAGYTIDIVKPGVPSDNPTVTRHEKTWVKLFRHNTSSQELYQNCMVSINGYYHMTDANSVDFFVVDGAKSLFKSGQNAVGMWSFKGLGGIRYIPITSSMLFKGEVNDLPFKTRVYINTGEDLSNKTVMMVLGGYLHFVDGDSLFQFNDTTFGLNISRLPLAERYQESFPYLDFSELALDTRADNPTVVDMEQFYSDEKLTEYLTMSQSFFVIIDKPNVFRNRIQIHNEPLPGSFLAYSEPHYPLVVGHGRVAEYWKKLEDRYWHLTVNDSYLQNKVFATLDYPEQTVGYGSNETMVPFYNSPAYLLELGIDY